ncbi:family transcriptional regulator [Leptolyngbya sp. Heron Island J]|uniref:TetR/AcrR family transcriptional regulator n=1 Tax=Leptolyngbya sp. Heron Island J TaxID=1385935 RepID=UPI0003B98B0D|nr:TetR/AcrR family transcriptional regulator [Leptolyngbya sp. Heron Island J]ESA38205.1 family transcriptional regulator [Leptolyngbya sp. Heron Island J]
MKGTAQQILNVAQDLVRCRGYSAFSYADISQQVGIRKASIHYHFPSKEALGKELVKRYHTNFQQKLKAIEQSESDPHQQLQQFVGLYRSGLSERQMCLCGMLSAEIEVLPDSIQEEVRIFLSETQAWLTDLLASGEAAGHLQPRISPETEASLLLATVQGAQLIARAATDSEMAFDAIAKPLLATLSTAG